MLVCLNINHAVFYHTCFLLLQTFGFFLKVCSFFYRLSLALVPPGARLREAQPGLADLSTLKRDGGPGGLTRSRGRSDESEQGARTQQKGNTKRKPERLYNRTKKGKQTRRNDSTTDQKQNEKRGKRRERDHRVSAVWINRRNSLFCLWRTDDFIKHSVAHGRVQGQESERSS